MEMGRNFFKEIILHPVNKKSGNIKKTDYMKIGYNETKHNYMNPTLKKYIFQICIKLKIVIINDRGIQE